MRDEDYRDLRSQIERQGDWIERELLRGRWWVIVGGLLLSLLAGGILVVWWVDDMRLDALEAGDATTDPGGDSGRGPARSDWTAY